MPNLSMGDGTPTGGVYGFAALSLELIKKLKPDYVCVAWDKPKTNIRRRKELYPEYKAGRKPAPPDFYVQIPILHELLEAFSWPLYESMITRRMTSWARSPSKRVSRGSKPV